MSNFDEEKQNKQLEEMYKDEEEELVEMLATTKYNLPYLNLTRLGIDNEALRKIPEKEARDLKIAPYKLSGKNIFIAVQSPREELLQKIKENMERISLVPHFSMVSLASLNKVWDRYTELSMAESSMVGGISISAEVLENTKKEIHKMQDITTLINQILEGKGTHKVSRILEIILAGAIAVEASDVHIEPEEERCRVRLRLDGVLQDIIFLNLSLYKQLDSRVKLLSGMKLTSKTAQDGRFSIEENGEEISIRSSSIPSAYGDGLVMRILDPKNIHVNIETLGIEPKLFSIIEEEIKKPNGMILVTGPTGSGKTTTLYAFLQKIYSTEINIITIEDPIEYHLKGLTQSQVDQKKGYSFLEGLRSALRQDPDVIMVGEIRDPETAKIAVESALTGHLVFSTLHTNNAAGVIPRLIDLDVNAKIMVSALSLSMAQRLVRKLCEHCKKEKPITEEEKNVINEILKEMKESGKNPKDYNVDTEKEYRLFGPAGCEKCNMTGYKGRIGIFEAIRTDASIEKIIPQNPSEREIKQVAKAQGILTMREDGVIKILTGITSYNEVQSVVDLKEE